MVQNWLLCDVNSLHKVSNNAGSTLVTLFFDDQHLSLEKLLEGDIFSGRDYIPLRLQSTFNSQGSSGLLNLLDILLARVLLSIPDDVDRCCFGLTCVRLFTVCEEHWLRHFPESFKRPRLLCVGDYSPWDPIGRTAFKAFSTLKHRQSALSSDARDREELYCFEDTKKMKNPYDVAEHLEDLPEYSLDAQRDPLAASLRILGEKAWKRIFQGPGRDKQHAVPSPFVSEVVAGKPEASILRRSLIFARTTPAKTPQHADKAKVLRNHTKKVFVTENPLFTGFKKHFGQKAPTFAQAVLSQICRSNQEERTMPIDLGGPWAGDELDIVSEEQFLEELKAMKSEDVKSWKNVSGRMLDDLWELLFASSEDLPPETDRWKASLVKHIKLRGKTAEDFLRQSLL